jgi:hypothetical protein
LIGGFAVAAWGVPRATQDIDFAVAIGTKDPGALATFMGGHYESGGSDDPLKGVIRATVTAVGGSVPLQLVFLPVAFTNAIFQHVETLSIMTHTAPIVMGRRRSCRALMRMRPIAGNAAIHSLFDVSPLPRYKNLSSKKQTPSRSV